jgi:hypothetical protein
MKVWVSNFNGIFNSITSILKIKGDWVPIWPDADVLLLWQDVMGELPEITKIARSSGKRVYVAEHGLLSINDYIPPLNKPLVADKFLAWGERTKRWLVELGKINPSRIEIVGTTLFDDFHPKKLHKGRNIVFAPRHWDRELDENIEMAEELRKIDGTKGITVFSKIIEGEHNPIDYPNPISSNRFSGDHLYQCWKVLSTADAVVTLGEGTFASMAYFMDIPVISGNRWDTKNLLGKDYDKAEFFSQVSGACSVVPIERLNSQVLKEIKHPELNREQRYNFLKDSVGYELERPAVENILRIIYEG